MRLQVLKKPHRHCGTEDESSLTKPCILPHAGHEHNRTKPYIIDTIPTSVRCRLDLMNWRDDAPPRRRDIMRRVAPPGRRAYDV